MRSSFRRERRWGQVSVEAEFTSDAGTLAANFPVLFVPEKSSHLLSRDTIAEGQIGLLCTPGFCVLEPFGTGTDADTQGWGGPR